MTTPALPDTLADVFGAMPAGTRRRLEAVRERVHAVAMADPSIGPITETLKWGQVPFVPEASQSGTTLRLAPSKPDGAPAIFVHCATSLVDRVRERHGDVFTCQGNRAILLPDEETTAAHHAELDAVIHLILTYER